jgi:hypothetical protein
VISGEFSAVEKHVKCMKVARQRNARVLLGGAFHSNDGTSLEEELARCNWKLATFSTPIALCIKM